LVYKDESIKSKVKFADNSVLIAEGTGNVMIRRKDGRKSLNTDVLYLPGIKNHLLSLGQLLEKGYTMTMEKGEMKVFHFDKKFILKAPLSKNRTFKSWNIDV